MRAPPWKIALLCLAAAVLLAAAPLPGAGSPYKAVLVAGEDDVPVFDHATEAMRDRLLARLVAPADIQRLSAAEHVVRRDHLNRSSLDQVLAAINGLHPAPGQSCFVFVTSHGGPGLGLVLAPREEFLTPAVLDRALLRGCGDAPTIVIASGCYSGTFAKAPMARANRIIFTAARADRPSFGCGAGFDYTVYDRCLLAAMDQAVTWREAYPLVLACVAREERALGFRASGPRASFGKSAAGLEIAGRLP